MVSILHFYVDIIKKKIPLSIEIGGNPMQKFLQDVNIGNNLRRLRKKRNLSQYDMVTKLQLLGRSMSRASYAHIEQGIRNIYISDLILFKEILDVDYGEFFEGLTPKID